MTTSVSSLELRRLEQLYSAGFEDPFLNNALRKILDRQIARDEADLARVGAALAELEQKYSMDSEQFWPRYRAGEMADTADFVEWNVLCKMKNRLLARLHILRGEAAGESDA